MWPQIPLAQALRPRSISDLVGQEHLLGLGQPLEVAFATKKIHSMILWGPPGVGKTTLARLMAKIFALKFIALSAVLAGVKDIREAILCAENCLKDTGQQTILFVDEIHRFNKSQQDALLPFVESGLLTFIGATTENPSFEVNNALLSRSQTYILKPLDLKDLKSLYLKAMIFLGEKSKLTLNEDAIELLASFADGDGRRFLNLLEQVIHSANHQKITSPDKIFLEKLLSQNPRRFDKSGEEFYDQISALHKSVRGSHPDAALYWLCRMLDGGTDPIYLARRIIRMAWEDIGLADPRAIQLANDAAQTYERLGSPEGDLALGEAVIYLAIAPKSNAAYKAFNQARSFVIKDHSRAVPLHLRNAPTNLMKNLDYGRDYRYVHDEPNGYAAGENYLPEKMQEPNWYQPSDRGLEQKISEKMLWLRELDKKIKD